jgi:phosphatidylglycerophosphate synthase
MNEDDRSTCTAVLLPPSAMSFHRIAGVPLIQRTALSALRSGFDAVVALAPGDGRDVRSLFARDARTAGIPVVGGALDAAITTDSIALIPSDCLIDAPTLARVHAAQCNGAPLVLRPPESTAAIVLAPRRYLAALDGGAGAPVATESDAAAIALDGGLCIPVPDAPAAAAAERALIQQLAALTADSDGPIARLDRAVSTRLSRYLVRTPLRPNHITTIGTAVGFLGAWALAQGTYGFGVLGTALFWLAVIIDGCDGEVARLKFQESRIGYLYDVTTDNIVHVAIFIGLGLGAYRTAPGGHLLWLIAIGVGGFAAAAAATLLTIVRHPPVQMAAPRSRRGRLRQQLLRGFDALMNRDFAYALLALAVIGRLDWFLWGAAFGTYAYAGALVLVYRWRDAD